MTPELGVIVLRLHKEQLQDPCRAGAVSIALLPRWHLSLCSPEQPQLLPTPLQDASLPATDVHSSLGVNPSQRPYLNPKSVRGSLCSELGPC